jgi:hypothetical protein
LGLVQAVLVEEVSLLTPMAIPDLPAATLLLARSLLRLAAELDLAELQQVERRDLLSLHQTQVVPQQQMAVRVELGCRSQRMPLQCVVALEVVLVEDSVPQMQHFKVVQEGALVL